MRISKIPCNIGGICVHLETTLSVALCKCKTKKVLALSRSTKSNLEEEGDNFLSHINVYTVSWSSNSFIMIKATYYVNK